MNTVYTDTTHRTARIYRAHLQTAYTSAVHPDTAAHKWERNIQRWLSRRGSAMLVLHPEGQTEQSWHLSHSQPLRIGRDAACEIRLPDPRVSRYHARVYWQDGDYYAEDLHSKNGTHINGQAITTAVLLRDGDELQIALCCKLSFLRGAA